MNYKSYINIFQFVLTLRCTHTLIQSLQICFTPRCFLNRTQTKNVCSNKISVSGIYTYTDVRAKGLVLHLRKNNYPDSYNEIIFDLSCYYSILYYLPFWNINKYSIFALGFLSYENTGHRIYFINYQIYFFLNHR